MDEYSFEAVAGELSAWGCRARLMSRGGHDFVVARLDDSPSVILGSLSGELIPAEMLARALAALGIDQTNEFTYYVGRWTRPV